MAVLLETSLGDIVIDLYTEQRPKCSLNFLKLCKMKYYNFCLFHTVQRNFLAQAGDPTGMTEGGTSIWGVIKGDDYRFFEGESAPRLKHEKMGTVSMVNNGHGCHGSQFYITTGENLSYLDGKHTVFGEVAEGVDVLMKINEAYCDKQGRPYQDIRIYHTVVLEDPFNDPEGLEPPSRSPSPPKVITDSNRIGAEEDVDDFKGMSEEQIQEFISSREAKANAQILEMVGDIPDADGRPPENVLFVCKLNPATTAEDLEIIFSRFGPILTCEVIKDHKTGDSLQYAFIEFEKEDDCISAYFKMDNVLIDDRRIHVDFCQSLAKVKGSRRRTFSEEDPMDMKKARSDGLVSKQKTRAGDYEMVFDEAEMARPLEKKKEKRKRRDSDDGSDRQHSRAQERERRDDRRERLERDGRGDERRGRHGDSGHYRQERERERRRDDRGGRESYKRPRQRERSRSRSRERHYRHHKERKRSRSRSRERHHRH